MKLDPSSKDEITHKLFDLIENAFTDFNNEKSIDKLTGYFNELNSKNITIKVKIGLPNLFVSSSPKEKRKYSYTTQAKQRTQKIKNIDWPSIDREIERLKSIDNNCSVLNEIIFQLENIEREPDNMYISTDLFCTPDIDNEKRHDLTYYIKVKEVKRKIIIYLNSTRSLFPTVVQGIVNN